EQSGMILEIEEDDFDFRVAMTEMEDSEDSDNFEVSPLRCDMDCDIGVILDELQGGATTLFKMRDKLRDFLEAYHKVSKVDVFDSYALFFPLEALFVPSSSSSLDS
ncbi:unnamed protein product, partial [Ilex paraguariensis]